MGDLGFSDCRHPHKESFDGQLSASVSFGPQCPLIVFELYASSSIPGRSFCMGVRRVGEDGGGGVVSNTG